MTPQQEMKLLKEKMKELSAQIPSARIKNANVKIGDKGTINFQLGRYPTCLYISQLLKLKEIVNSPEFDSFIQANESKISRKVEINEVN